LVGERTALINFLLERGLAAPQGRRKLEQYLETQMAEEQLPLSARTRALIEDQRAEWCELDRRISVFDNEFAEVARSGERARLLTSIPGIGVLNATAF
jgi:transposase